jgi:hypothetical protein
MRGLKIRRVFTRKPDNNIGRESKPGNGCTQAFDERYIMLDRIPTLHAL